jgi:hypothetical protein
MLYIHHTSCVSPQQTFPAPAPDILHESSENKLKVIEPSYGEIPVKALRRMGKAVRISVGAALPLLKQAGELSGIIIGTANGGMEDCIRFMNQIIQYDEDMLAPGNFVQSTPNGIAAQIGLSQGNRGYNITHVHRGHAFEQALTDAWMRLREFPQDRYLLGATDEISSYNYNVDFLDGWYKKETVSNTRLYESDSPASIAGEGAAMFLVSAAPEQAIAAVTALHTFHSREPAAVKAHIQRFVTTHLGENGPDLLISGENGDNRLTSYYLEAETLLPPATGLLRFKHMCGEYPTASSYALWLACHLLQNGALPAHAVKRAPAATPLKQILIYNNYKGEQHSLMLVRAAQNA